MTELGVTVGVLSALVLLGRRLQAVAHLVQQLGHRHMGDLIALCPQLPGQGSGGLGSPAQSAHRIATALGVHQLVEGQEQAGLGVDGLRAARSRRSHPHADLNAGVDLADGLLHRGTAHARRLGHGHDPASTHQAGH